jgi:hypothetical protein
MAALEHEKAERRDAIAELIVARKGWLERLLEAVRRRQSRQRFQRCPSA